jgi:hypothetical protein
LGNIPVSWEVSSNYNGTLPDGNRQACVTRQFNKEATCPKNRPGSFIGHRHGVPLEGLREESLIGRCLAATNPVNLMAVAVFGHFGTVLP